MEHAPTNEFLTIYFGNRIPKVIQKAISEPFNEHFYEKSFGIIFNYLKKHRESKTIHHQQTSAEINLVSSLSRIPPLYSFVLLAKYRWNWNIETISNTSNESIQRILFIHDLAIDELIERVDSEHVSSKEELIALIKAIKIDQIEKKISQDAVKTLHNIRSKWIVKILSESALVLVTLVFIFWVVPELRSTYEGLISKKVNSYLLDDVMTSAPVPPGMEQKVPQTPAVSNSEITEPIPTQAKLERSKPPKVTEGELWRFSFTGIDPSRIQDFIQKVISEQFSVSAKAVQVPGGIQYEFPLKTNELADLKFALEKEVFDLREKIQKETQGSDPNPGVHMSWYKRPNPNSKNLAPGTIRVVLWISTL